MKTESEEAETNGSQYVLEILDDLPETDVEPLKNVLFVYKLNPLTYLMTWRLSSGGLEKLLPVKLSEKQNLAILCSIFF